MKPRVKICCISSLEEAQAAVQFGASALGLVGHMPSGPGVIPDDLIAQIAQQIPPGVSSFLLTSHTKVDQIIQHQQIVKTNTIQIVDTLTEGSHEAIRLALPAIKIVQVIHVINENTIDEALAAAETADALLLDSGNPNLRVKELGGTGRVHNWDISRKIVEQSNKPVFLAGGLNAENVQAAIEAAQPFGIDLCSGVRTGGKLDLRKLDGFFKAVYNL
ncbi:MAG: phosphoribosylanthranilate isomerase [Saprospiraceae bacterium]|nr:phosphoribosylanthranilate isomerase [Saprospiraceae bacterium]